MIVIPVKGRCAGADTVTVTRNEILPTTSSQRSHKKAGAHTPAC